MRTKLIRFLVFVISCQLVVTAEKAGKCPTHHQGLYHPRYCTKDCQTDAQCSTNKKCCQIGCSTLCKDPIIGQTNEVAEPCNLPKSAGTCRGWLPRWFYNKHTKRCEFLFYGGCGGNANIFRTLDTCKYRCEIKESHAGSCPRPTYAYGICSFTSLNCNTDIDCRSTEKCCHEGCGRTCKTAVLKAPSTRTEIYLNSSTRKPKLSSLSPPRSSQTSTPSCPVDPVDCSRWPSFPCNDNSHCSGESLCCYTKCGRRCTSVESSNSHSESKPGKTPNTPQTFYPDHDIDDKYSRYSGNGPCIHHCTTDADCYYGQVCSGECLRMCRGPKMLNFPARGPHRNYLNKPTPQMQKQNSRSTTQRPPRSYINQDLGLQWGSFSTTTQRTPPHINQNFGLQWGSPSITTQSPIQRYQNNKIGPQIRYTTTQRPAQSYSNQPRRKQKNQYSSNRGPGPQLTDLSQPRGPQQNYV